MPPTLSFQRESAAVLRPGAGATLTCVAPLSGVEFQLQQGEKELLVPRSSTSPDRIFFDLNAVALGNGGLYTCRYRLHGEQTWSSDSAPVELLLSDGKPGSHRPGHGHGGGRARALCSGRDPGKGPPELEGSGWGPIPTHPPSLSFPS